ncbi:hypothetical protein [Paraliomyxa miuraensis]|uniref:hypothetical protein n=1 Tax=Paraliomyxa miuraensis TaxID=376150 RepID=UPI0022529063|nr:hypothetical protein [Paraliomyxa miuraensis]MCX4245141.1 hypothetical protein [Paraliomyxa miuraensis]
MRLLRFVPALLLLSLCPACIGPLAPYEPLISPLLPEPDCTGGSPAPGSTQPPEPARCEVGVEVPLPGRRR